MGKEEIFSILHDKEKWDVYKRFQEIESSIEQSNELYQYIDEIIDMLRQEKGFIKVRGFRLLCKLSKWDVDNKINKNVNTLLEVLDDDKPTNVRQYLNSLNTLIQFKPELLSIIKDGIKDIDCFKYKDSMRTLIEKDIEIILKTDKKDIKKDSTICDFYKY